MIRASGTQECDLQTSAGLQTIYTSLQCGKYTN